MTKKEVTVMLAYFKTAYKSLFDNTDSTATISLWHEMLIDEELILATNAAKKYVADNKYPPSISEILDLIEKEKWQLYTDYVMDDISDDNNRLKKLPSNLMPRSINRQPKSFETNGNENIDSLVSDYQIKLLEDNNR